MFDQQLDINGDAHDLAPETETMRLFDSAPQIRGQIALDTDAVVEPLTREQTRANACPTCHAPAGRACKRPSGHRAMSPHAARVELAREDSADNAPESVERRRQMFESLGWSVTR